MDTERCLSKVPDLRGDGERLALVLDRFLDANNSFERDLFQAIRSDKANVTDLSARLLPLRHLVAEELSAHGTPGTPEVRNAACSAMIRVGLLQAWPTAANDPCAILCCWLFEGAPAGLYKLLQA